MLLGRCYLLSVLQRVSTSEVALRARVSPSAVRKYSAGVRTPSARVRVALEVHLRIPSAAWSELPTFSARAGI